MQKSEGKSKGGKRVFHREDAKDAKEKAKDLNHRDTESTEKEEGERGQSEGAFLEQRGKGGLIYLD